MRVATTTAGNLLYYGDNLDIMQRYIKDESVDLVYLDPPFNSSQTYNVLFSEKSGSRATSQIKAFHDTWHWDGIAAESFEHVVELGNNVSQAMLAFRALLGTNDMLAYLAMMAPRLLELKRVLKPTGSIYLHCDPTASHYLKLLMDAVFDPENFRNEIIWGYDTGGRAKNHFPRKHDTILWYSKSDEYIFNYDAVALKRDTSTMHEPILHDDEGRPYQRNVKHGKEYRYYLDKGVLPNDWWTDLPALNPAAKERLGYPTQKPEALLERILTASSREGDIVLDPFCGCGTTVAVAQRLNRRWIGIDITNLAINLIRRRLSDTYGPAVEKTYRVIGEPVSVEDAEALAKSDPYQFQWWALDLVGARPADQKKGADKGIDGRLYFHDEADGASKQIIFSVKAGHVTVSQLRDLRGVIDREKARIGVLISFETPTQPMKTEAASAGFYDSPSYGKFPRLQLLTVEQLLAGERIKSPPLRQTNATFKKAPRTKGSENKAATLALPLGDDTKS